MILNPWAKIRDLEQRLEAAELARVRLEDEVRHLRSANDTLREREAQTRRDEMQRMEKVSDWMALQNGRRAVFSNEVPPAAAPLPPTRGSRHGADIEKAMMQEVEKELGIGQLQ